LKPAGDDGLEQKPADVHYLDRHWKESMGRFAVISMTERAATRVREITGAREGVRGIRLGIKKGGCAGMEYTVGLVTEPNPKDDHVEHDGAHVYIAPEAALFLLGTEMDFETTTLRTGFTFKNPNQSSACGCGESVELKPADLKALAEARASAPA
jgi:iron-sulfur cluster assembly protein